MHNPLRKKILQYISNSSSPSKHSSPEPTSADRDCSKYNCDMKTL